MTLMQAIEDLEQHDAEATIYAAKPWQVDSQALVAFEPASGGLPANAEGMSYFLEVFVARDFIEDWEPSLETMPTIEEKCARLIQYAINDA